MADLNQKKRPPFSEVQRYAGLLLAVVGLLLMVLAALQAAIVDDNLRVAAYDAGPLAAVGFFGIMLGISFMFPDMLQDELKAISTMRVVVFIVISVFGIVAIRIGWNARSFDEFQLDSTWVYIVGLAFGGKVFQKYSEEVYAKQTSPPPDANPQQQADAEDIENN